jgi:hypothetical protein
MKQIVIGLIGMSLWLGTVYAQTPGVPIPVVQCFPPGYETLWLEGTIQVVYPVTAADTPGKVVLQALVLYNDRSVMVVFEPNGHVLYLDPAPEDETVAYFQLKNRTKCVWSVRKAGDQDL